MRSFVLISVSAANSSRITGAELVKNAHPTAAGDALMSSARKEGQFKDLEYNHGGVGGASVRRSPLAV